MTRSCVRWLAAAAASLAAALLVALPSSAEDKPAVPPTSKEYSEQGLLDAAYDYCATVENRAAKSCDCEQKLLKQPDRLDQEGREMAFWYWTNPERFKQEFEARRTADPQWQEGFALKMANWAALVTAACGA